MSSAGRVPAWVIEKQRLEIERKREAERRQRVRLQIAQICLEIKNEITSVVNSGKGAWASAEISAVTEVIDQADSIDEGDVDDMLNRASQARAQLSQIGLLSEKRMKEKKLTLDLKTNYLEGLLIELKNIRVELIKNNNQNDFQNLISKVEEMLNQINNNSEEEIQHFVEQSRAEAEQIRATDSAEIVQEELRRHIVSSLINSMNELGFVVGKPKLIKESRKVAVVGKLSSGRNIRFDVTESGEMEFDMEGFSDRKCADHLDDVLLKLEENFGIESGPVQHNWKNPDRISKGSKGFPTGGNTRSLGGGNR
jgi:hypothetical protein|tara:strand:+ start:1848 stop:2777 length:930 start_codon:yes stop_codon:yes gene_type:complete